MKKEFKDYLSGIDKGNINQRMLELPSQVFDHSYHYAGLSSELKDKKDEMDLLVSQLSAQTRRILESRGTKAFTENRIKDMVNSQEEVIEIKKEVNDIEKKVKRSKAYLEALKTAREVLPNVSHNFREERRSTEKLTPRKRSRNER